MKYCFLILLISLTSCQATRQASLFVSDSAHKQATDSSYFSKSQKNENEQWYRELLLLMGHRGDTPNYNFNIPSSNLPATNGTPAVVYLKEGGTKSKEESKTDTGTLSRINEVERRLQSAEKKAITKVLTWKDLLLLGVGIVVAIKLLNFLPSFQIVRR